MTSAGLIYEVLWGRKGSPLSLYRVAASPEEAQGVADFLLSDWACPGDTVAILEYKVIGPYEDFQERNVIETREVFRQVKGFPQRK